MQMASNPHQFDVLVMGNLYGSILDNIGAGLVGGAGVVAGSSYSPNAVVYEPVTCYFYFYKILWKIIFKYIYFLSGCKTHLC
jgi:hypothetical protein